MLEKKIKFLKNAHIFIFAFKAFDGLSNNLTNARNLGISCLRLHKKYVIIYIRNRKKKELKNEKEKQNLHKRCHREK